MSLLLPTGLVFSPPFHWECSLLRVSAYAGPRFLGLVPCPKVTLEKQTAWSLVSAFTSLLGLRDLLPFFQVQLSIWKNVWCILPSISMNFVEGGFSGYLGCHVCRNGSTVSRLLCLSKLQLFLLCNTGNTNKLVRFLGALSRKTFYTTQNPVNAQYIITWLMFLQE